MAASFWFAGPLRAVVVATCLLPVVQACGSRSDTEDYLYDAGGTINVGATSSNAGRGATSTGGTRAGVGGSAPVGATGNVAGTTAGGAVSTGGSGIIEAGRGGVAGAISTGGRVGTGGVGVAGSGMAGAAGASGGQTIITCGSDTCDALSQTCCFSGGFQCIAEGAACPGPVLGCTTQSDCGDERCCLSITGDVSDASSCKPRCSIGSSRDRQLCDVDADCQPPFRFCRTTVFGLNLCVLLP